MTRKLDEGTVDRIRATLVERFGDPITGDGQGVPSSSSKKDMGNRGFGAKTCECGGLTGMDEAEACTQCGMIAPSMDEEVGGRHPGHAASCTCPDCARPAYDDQLGEATYHPAWTPPADVKKTWVSDNGETRGYCQGCKGRGKLENHKGKLMVCPYCKGGRIVTIATKPVDEVAPPGREKQVKALKKNKDIDNPWAVAWSSYNKR